MSVDPVLLQTMQADGVAARVLRALADAGIDAVLLKGSTFADLYPDRPRQYVDADVLVRAEDERAAVAILDRLGFSEEVPGARRSEQAAHATTWVHPDLPSVDLHTTLAGVTATPSRLWEVLEARTEPHLVAGEHVRRLDRVGRALHLALHAAQSGTGRTRTIDDLSRGLTAFDEGVWSEATRLAADVGASVAFAAGLRTTPTGQALADRIGADGDDPPLEVLLQARSASHPAVSLARMRAQPTWRRRLAYLLGRAFPSPGLIRAKEPIARRGGGWLLVGYASRWLHVARLLPGALREHRQARRRT